MGALHAGHIKLIETARRGCDLVIVSIFVNPLQFDRPEDLERYPRNLQADMDVCRDSSVDVVFAPAPAEIYPQAPLCSVDVGLLGDHLCGKYRPGHFRGVATVVLKLLEIVQPHKAYFGEKDAQQLAIVRRMVADFSLHVEIVSVPTVRESDGLALSSRNRHLSAHQRELAATLYQAQCEAERLISSGERNVSVIRNAAMARIPQSETLRIEYLEIVDPDLMQPVGSVTGPVRVAIAVWIGSTRLIDNVLVPVPGE
jgi:pantoate--beta-alanine ligase